MKQDESIKCPKCSGTEIRNQKENNGVHGSGYKSWVALICKNCGERIELK